MALHIVLYSRFLCLWREAEQHVGHVQRTPCTALHTHSRCGYWSEWLYVHLIENTNRYQNHQCNFFRRHFDVTAIAWCRRDLAVATETDFRFMEILSNRCCVSVVWYWLARKPCVTYGHRTERCRGPSSWLTLHTRGHDSWREASFFRTCELCTSPAQILVIAWVQTFQYTLHSIDNFIYRWMFVLNAAEDGIVVDIKLVPIIYWVETKVYEEWINSATSCECNTTNS